MALDNKSLVSSANYLTDLNSMYSRSITLNKSNVFVPDGITHYIEATIGYFDKIESVDKEIVLLAPVSVVSNEDVLIQIENIISAIFDNIGDASIVNQSAIDGTDVNINISVDTVVTILKTLNIKIRYGSTVKYDVDSISDNYLQILTSAGVIDTSVFENIEILAKNVDNVIITGVNINSVNTVAENIDNVNITSENIVDIDIVATDINSVKNVSSNIDKVSTVSDNINSVIVAFDNILDISTVSDNILNVNNTGENIDSVNTVSNDITNVNINALNILDININANNILDINTTAESIDSVNTNATNIENINTNALNISDINIVALNILDINSIEDTVVPNIVEILEADTNAKTATTKANEATSSAANALSSANTATTKATEASNSANIATTKASESSASASSALSSANSADLSEANALSYKNSAEASAISSSASASTSITQAGIATTKAAESLASATNSATSEANALSYKNSANTSAKNAATSATTATSASSNASISATNSANSATAAATSESNALSYKNSAFISATNASTSATTSTTKASEASSSAASAATSAATANTKAGEASTSASNALASKNSAEKWASEAEDVVVASGKYSSYHYMLKAKKYASLSLSVIDDTVVGTDTTYSSNKIENDLNVIGFDLTADITVSPGQIAWNATEGTYDMGLENGSVLQAGQENIRKVTNNSGALISDGILVMYNGTNGASGRINVKPFTAGFNEAIKLYGIATQSIANGADGIITVEGKVRGIDTTGASVGEVWADNDILYAKPNDNGMMTKIEPADNELKIVVASVIKAHHTNGTLEIRFMPFNENMYYTKVQNDILLDNKVPLNGDFMLDLGEL